MHSLCNTLLDVIVMREKESLAERVFEESGMSQSYYASGAEGQSAIENIGELINAASVFDQQLVAVVRENGESEESNLLDFLQQISLFSDADAYDKSTDRLFVTGKYWPRLFEIKLVPSE